MSARVSVMSKKVRNVRKKFGCFVCPLLIVVLGRAGAISVFSRGIFAHVSQYQDNNSSSKTLQLQPVVRARRYTDQGGRRPSRPVQFSVDAIEEIKGKEDILAKNL